MLRWGCGEEEEEEEDEEEEGVDFSLYRLQRSNVRTPSHETLPRPFQAQLVISLVFSVQDRVTTSSSSVSKTAIHPPQVPHNRYNPLGPLSNSLQFFATFETPLNPVATKEKQDEGGEDSIWFPSVLHPGDIMIKPLHDPPETHHDPFRRH